MSYDKKPSKISKSEKFADTIGKLKLLFNHKNFN